MNRDGKNRKQKYIISQKRPFSCAVLELAAGHCMQDRGQDARGVLRMESV
jgi:hypothetical protein